MKGVFVTMVVAVSGFISLQLAAQTSHPTTSGKTMGTKKLYIDVHHLEPGKVKFEGVAQAHTKDLATQAKYGAEFIKYWVDEKKGLVYCLVAASDSEAIRSTHAEAHGLLPDHIYLVTDGPEAASKGQDFFLDVHELGKVSAKDVAGAHAKDLATQGKYGVNFINYWVNEKEGLVFCLSQAKDSSAIIQTHKEAHGLVPAYVLKVKQGQ